MDSRYNNKYNPFPGEFILNAGERKDAIRSFWNKVIQEAEEMVEGCGLSNVAFDKFRHSTQRHFNRIIEKG